MSADETRALVAGLRAAVKHEVDGTTIPVSVEDCRAIADALEALLPVPAGDARERACDALGLLRNYAEDGIATGYGTVAARIVTEQVDIVLAALSRAAAPEPEWEYGAAHTDHPQNVAVEPSLEAAQRRVTSWNRGDSERKGIVVRAPKRVWEPLPGWGESNGE